MQKRKNKAAEELPLNHAETMSAENSAAVNGVDIRAEKATAQSGEKTAAQNGATSPQSGTVSSQDSKSTSAAQSETTFPQSGESIAIAENATNLDANLCLKNDTKNGEDIKPLYTPQGAQAAVPFVITRTDWLFALLYFVLGECYWRLLLKESFSETWAGAAVFTVIYAACVLGYVFAKRRTVPRASWFWLAVLLAEGVSSTLWPNAALSGYAGVILHGTAIYWTLCATDVLVARRTSCFLPADLLNGFAVVPFANFFARIRCLWYAVRREVSHKSILHVLLGVLLLAGVLCLVLPRLATADEAFYNVFDDFMKWLGRLVNGEVLKEVQYFVLSLPVAAYLFGLAYGAINRRNTHHLALPRLQKAVGAAHVVPGVSVHILLVGVCALYVLFIALQAQQLFAAFRGQLSGTQIYSQYAREGFFGLCQVAVINGAVLLFVQVFARGITRTIKILQTTLCVLTLLILASAARKLALYIEAYDLTPSRLLAMVFMVWLAVAFTALVVRLYVPFPYTRTVVCVGAVLVVILFVCNVDACIESFNAAHISINELHTHALA